MIDSNGLMHQVNDAAIAFLGYKPVEVMGRNVSMFMPEPHRTQHDGYLKR
jgi:PAS domain S-box-containing protein